MPCVVPQSWRGDHHVLGHVGQLAGQVARVGRLQGRIGQALAGTVGRAEILQHGQPLAEIGLNRRLDDLARRLGHQTAHAGQLPNLLDAAAGTGVGHQEDRVHVAGRNRGESFSNSCIISVVICSRAWVQASSTWL